MSAFPGIAGLVAAGDTRSAAATSRELLDDMEAAWAALARAGSACPDYIIVPRHRRTVRWRGKRMTIHGLPAWLQAVKVRARGT